MADTGKKRIDPKALIETLKQHKLVDLSQPMDNALKVAGDHPDTDLTIAFDSNKYFAVMA